MKTVPLCCVLLFVLYIGVTLACAAIGGLRVRRGFFDGFGDFGGSPEYGGGGHGHGHGHGHGGGNCEESQCGYNIRHCPHGCHFNSFQCGSGGAAYDQCCC